MASIDQEIEQECAAIRLARLTNNVAFAYREQIRLVVNNGVTNFKSWGIEEI